MNSVADAGFLKSDILLGSVAPGDLSHIHANLHPRSYILRPKTEILSLQARSTLIAVQLVVTPRSPCVQTSFSIAERMEISLLTSLVVGSGLFQTLQDQVLKVTSEEKDM